MVTPIRHVHRPATTDPTTQIIMAHAHTFSLIKWGWIARAHSSGGTKDFIVALSKLRFPFLEMWNYPQSNSDACAPPRHVPTESGYNIQWDEEEGYKKEADLTQPRWKTKMWKGWWVRTLWLKVSPSGMRNHWERLHSCTMQKKVSERAYKTICS